MRQTKIVRTTITRRSSASDYKIWPLAVVFACIALLFAIVSLATSGWNGHNVVKGRGKTYLDVTVLSFLAIFFLILGIISMILFATQLITSFSSVIKASAIVLLALAEVFLVAAYTSFFTYNSKNYGYYLMITSGILTFISSIIAAFWVGRNWIAL